jgi:hypothetical protein
MNDLTLKKSIVLFLVACALIISTKAQTVTIGTGIGTSKAVPVQLMAGYSKGRSEIMVGYTVFFHKYDATFPDLYTLRYGFNILNESLEIIPMIGLTLTSPTTFDDMKPGSTEVVTPGSLKPYYGLKFQKMNNIYEGANSNNRYRHRDK